MKRLNLAVAFLVALAVLASWRPAFALGVSGGDVPVPAKLVSGTLQSTWDGAYSDLLAADALATCWTTQQDRGIVPGNVGMEGDGLLISLISRMVMSSCHTTCSNPSFTQTEDIQICAYLDSRKDANCNMDPASGQSRALDVSTIRSSSQTAPYLLPSAVSLGLTGAAASDIRALSQQEVAYADLSLCMAEQLRQKLDTVQVAFASNEDLNRVQELVRERSLTAVYEYTVLGKVFASTIVPPTNVSSNSWYLSGISQWFRNYFSASLATRFGEDFSEAIKLLVEATENSIQLKMRDPLAQDSFGTPSWDPLGGPAGGRLLSNGLVGAREDILEKVLFDGYDSTSNTIKRRSVSTDASDPKVSSLLGLARSANALKLHVSGNPQFVSGTNASTLLLSVENFVRNQDCINRGVAAGACALADGSTPATSYFLWQRYGIGLSHAQTLVDSLTEALFGPPTDASRTTGQWVYDPLFTGSALGPANPGEQLTMHFFGGHQFTGDRTQQYPVGDVILDPNFAVRPPTSGDIQSMRLGTYLPVRDVDPRDAAQFEIGLFRLNPINAQDSYGYPTDRRQLGSSTVLALARETLLQLSAVGTVATGIYTQAAPAVTLIEKMIGPRQILLRQATVTVPYTSACATCVYTTPRITASGAVTTNYVNVDFVSKSGDPLNRIAIVPGIPLAATLVKDASTTTIFGDSQASAIAPLAYATPSSVSYNGGYVMQSTSGSWLSSSQGFVVNPALSRGVSVILKSSTAPTTYEHAFTGNLNYTGSGLFAMGIFGIAVTFGGQFEREVDDAWTFDGARWAVPKYDGFGLVHDWVPSADASLLGDPVGTSVETHFLDRATTAADESSGALQEAFDTLQQQSIDSAAVLSSDARAADLTKLQYKSLCGDNVATTCAPSYTRVLPTVPSCTPADADCETFRASLGRIVGNPTTGPGAKGIALATAVAQAITSADPAPTFDTYRGGTLQGLLLAEWTAWRALTASMKSAVNTSRAAIAQVAAASGDLTAAQADLTSVDADIATAYAQIGATNATIAAQSTEYQNNKAQYAAQVSAAKQAKTAECSAAAYKRARDAGFSYSWGGPGDVRVEDSMPNTVPGVEYGNSTWSPSAAYAQLDRCHAATTAYNSARLLAASQTDTMNALLGSLAAQSALTGAQFAAVPTRHAAADAHVQSANLRVDAANSAAASQQSSATESVQAALGQLLSAAVAIAHAYTEADVDVARIAVDAKQANVDIRTRFGVRARYHSYDLWRARALTENARRLAVAARRALEARYVVNLSGMNAPEPFVDSPALWADQIYSSDLKPFAIGLTKASTDGSGLNTSVVKDYVSNLKLFMDGFAVQRPTAAVLSDAEVIQLPAPASQVLTSAYGTPVDYIDPASSGWSFYCPATDVWISDPDSATFTSTAPVWTLSKACSGSAPTLARFSFSLDPWGRLDGSPGNPPYAARYNVRARSVALNLVGSGIRSCERTADPSTCYAEPFILYDLKHIGPAWVTSYDQSWHSLNIPVAVIEGGKALATEEWLDPVSNGFNRSDVANVSRGEFADQPIGGAYELTLRLTPDINIERIERIQVLTQTGYWVRQQ